MTRIILIAAALILVAAVVVGFVLSRIISRPLQKLETAMEAFEQNADGFVFNSITGFKSREFWSTSSDGHNPYNVIPALTISIFASRISAIPALLEQCLTGIETPLSSIITIIFLNF